MFHITVSCPTAAHPPFPPIAQIEENGGCWVWLNLLVVFVVFALTIVFIKFTNFLP